jgi:hypothetical protein
VLSKQQGSPAGVPRLDPVGDMAISDPQLTEAVARVAQLEQQLASNPGERPCALHALLVLRAWR